MGSCRSVIINVHQIYAQNENLWIVSDSVSSSYFNDRQGKTICSTAGKAACSRLVGACSHCESVSHQWFSPVSSAYFFKVCRLSTRAMYMLSFFKILNIHIHSWSPWVVGSHPYFKLVSHNSVLQSCSWMTASTFIVQGLVRLKSKSWSPKTGLSRQMKRKG